MRYGNTMWKMLFAKRNNLKVEKKHRKRKQMKTMAGNSFNLCTRLTDNRGNITPDYDE